MFLFAPLLAKLVMGDVVGGNSISDITYVNNLLTMKNKLNMEVIPANNDGTLILNIKGIQNENYHLINFFYFLYFL